MIRLSFRARLGTLVAAAVGVTVALASFASYVTVKHQMFSQVDSSLVSDVANPPRTFDPTQVGGFLRRDSNSIFQLITPAGTVFWTNLDPSSPLPVSAAQAAIALSAHGYTIKTVTYDRVRYRVITKGGYASLASATPLAIQLARPLSDIEHTLGDLRLILWLVSLIGVAVAVALGWLIGRSTLRPVKRLTAAAEHVAATQDLTSEIEEQGDDELARLARSFNSMLGALAVSRHQQAQLISDTGHELRTPLTSLRTNIEVLMRTPDLPEGDKAELVADVHAQLEELTTLIGDVVDLARDDEVHAEPIEVRFDAVVARAVERVQRRANLISFETNLTPGSIRAQPTLLERAVLNVLDNAAKWSPPGATVSVWLQRGDSWSLDVRDQGPGISAEDLPHVFDRFYRAESARAMPGSGLGLAIVRQVVGDHGGTVTAFCPPEGGTVVHIELPTVTEQEPEPESAADDPAQAHAAQAKPARDPASSGALGGGYRVV